MTPSTHKFLDEGAILIGLPITDELAADFSDALRELVARKKDAVTVYINSPGGMAEASLRILDSIEMTDLKVRTVCLGRASGSAAHIFVAGDERFAVSDAVISFEDLRGDDRHDSSVIAALRSRFVEHTARRLGIDESSVSSWLSSERAFVGSEVLNSGLAQGRI
jgi:ATP-dependent Clp protease, protease subunit